MTDAMKNALETLTAKAENADKAVDALQFTQAALNLAHVVATLYNMRE